MVTAAHTEEEEEPPPGALGDLRGSHLCTCQSAAQSRYSQSAVSGRKKLFLDLVTQPQQLCSSGCVESHSIQEAASAQTIKATG